MSIMKNVGGQAVIEGVMMRAGDYVVTAVRNPKGKIVFKKEKVDSLAKKAPFKFMFIRGVVVLFESLSVGMRSLNYSAEVASGKKESKTSGSDIALTIFSFVFALAIAIALFKFVPLALTQLASRFSSSLSNSLAFNALEGAIKLAIFVGYIALISRMKDIKRVFQYHGAEHKAINCLEAKKKLTVDNTREFSTLNPRCGTSFLLFVILISIFVYIFIPMNFSFWAKFSLRLLLLPVIAGMSYELLKLASKYSESRLFHAVSAPGLWMQKLTTKEPDDKQLEVALFSLKKALKYSNP